MQIGQFKDKWVQIKLKSGKTGYMFGAFLFEMDAFFKNTWSYISFSEYAEGLKFNRNGTYSYYYSEYRHTTQTVGNIDLKGNYVFKTDGVYIVSKRILKIAFNQNRTKWAINNFFNKLSFTRLFYFRYNGKNLLSGKKYGIEQKFPYGIDFMGIPSHEPQILKRFIRR